MGWRERDWARFDDAERGVFFGVGYDGIGHAPGAVSSNGVPWNAPVGAWTIVAAVLGIAGFLGYQVHTGRARPALVEAAPSAVVTIRWRPADVAPAAAAGRICLTTVE